ASLSLAWDSSFDASSPNGVYFYDATLLDRLGSSASSLLLISIEDPQGSVATEEVSTRADVHSIHGLDDETDYVLNIVHRVTLGDDSRNSEALEIPVRIAATPQLSSPEVTAAFVARRSSGLTLSNIRVAWSFDENASGYSVNIYRANESVFTFATRLAPAAEHVFENFSFNQFFTAGVTAMAEDPATHLNSEEVRVSVLPPKLLSEFFTVTPSSASLSLAWDSSFDASLEDGVYFYDATFIGRLGSSASSLLLISIEDPQGSEIIGTAEVSTDADVYSTDGLDEATNYVLNIVNRVTVGGTTLDSEALEIPFRTLEVLPEPTEIQISSTVEGTTLIVGWDNVATGVTTYELSLTREGTPIGTPKEVNALVAGSTTFTGLDAETAYILSVVAKGDASVYAPSSQYSVNVVTGFQSLRLELTVKALSNIEGQALSGSAVQLTWQPLVNAIEYQLQIYLGAPDVDGSVFARADLVEIMDSMTGMTQQHTFNNLSLQNLYTVIMTATVQRNGSIVTSPEVEKTVRIPFFELIPAANFLTVRWLRDSTDIWKSYNADQFRFTISDTNNNEILVAAVPAQNGVYQSTGLTAGRRYTVNIALAGTIRGDADTHRIADRDNGEGDGVSTVADAFGDFDFETEQVNLIPPTEQNITTDAGGVTITVEWTNRAPLPAIEGYEIRILSNGTQVGNAFNARIDANNRQHVFTGLTPNVAYTLEARSFAGELNAKSAPYSETITTRDIPTLSMPTLTIDTGATEFGLSWTSVPFAEDYTVSIRLASSATIIIAQDVVQDTRYIFKDLMPGTAYIIDVVASAPDYINSDNILVELTTGKIILPTPTGNEISITSLSPSSVRITVHEYNALADSYLISLGSSEVGGG
ncbi:MAG: fibronectin type III domain-containing protein, partial [Candidatus Oxydemutatoraceae bacterium WSBS_2016_MAG_OTU14]